MELSLEQIRSITCGAISVGLSPEGVRFYRFTQEQYELYKHRKQASYLKALGTAGVKLSFRTDSTRLYLKALFEKTCLRTYFSVDIYVNGVYFGNIDNYSHLEIPTVYSTMEFDMGEYDGTFELGSGEKTVVIHLPWNAQVALQMLTLDDGATLEPVKPAKTLLAFGDSITHGFDALHPSRRYIARLADALNAQEYNKAVGGEFFWGVLGAAKDPIDPDYIVIAYGTNDWKYAKRELFIRESTSLIRNIRNNYPQAKIFVISPIWRKYHQAETAFSSFHEIDSLLRDAVQGVDNVTVIRGFDFVPKEGIFFGDGTLHPTDEGFLRYFESLWQEIRDLV